MRLSWLIGWTLLALAVACGSGGDDGEEAVKGVAGEACEAVDTTVCGLTEGALDSVLTCTAFDDKGTNKWTEKQVCSKAENCVEDSACQVDCESAWICDGKECGDDGCGGSCGGCDAGMSCIGNECKDVICTASCGAAECGPDGCGNTCGECGGTTVCMPPAYVCMEPPADCKPDCLNKACGPNGCGGTCGSCPGGTMCAPETQTCELPCMPDCTGKDCGDDGCGGTCGACMEVDQFCLPDGTCGPCDPILNEYCPPEQYCTYGNDEAGNSYGPVCEDAGTQMYGEPCGGVDSCAEGICSALNEGEPLCYQICKTNADCGEGKQCIELSNSTYKLCTVGGGSFETCNLLTQGCTLDTEACYFNSNAGEPICMEEGPGEEGDGCTGQANECIEGLTCVSYSTTWTCRRFCNTKKGEEPLCDNPLYPKCTNYYALQSAGFCTED